MYLLGDIGNTETKIFLITPSHKIKKKIIFPTKSLDQIKLNRIFTYFITDYKKLKKNFIL